MFSWHCDTMVFSGHSMHRGELSQEQGKGKRRGNKTCFRKTAKGPLVLGKSLALNCLQANVILCSLIASHKTLYWLRVNRYIKLFYNFIAWQASHPCNLIKQNWETRTILKSSLIPRPHRGSGNETVLKPCHTRDGSGAITIYNVTLDIVYIFVVPVTKGDRLSVSTSQD